MPLTGALNLASLIEIIPALDEPQRLTETKFQSSAMRVSPVNQAESPSVHIDFLNRSDISSLELTDDDIIAAVEVGLAMQGRGETAIEPRVHLEPRAGVEGHFNVLRGWLGGHIDQAGVKVVGDFVGNYKEGRPSEYGLLALFDPLNGAPTAIIDATGLTDMRTGAITAIGAKHLARKGSKILGHVGARGTAYWNVRLLDRLFNFDEIRVHSRRAESRDSFAARLSNDLGKQVVATLDWQILCRRGRHRGGSLAAVDADADAENGLDQEGRAGHPLRNHECRRIEPHRHHGQNRG